MRYRRATEHPAMRRVEIFLTPSGLGGVFCVSVVADDLPDGRVMVRIHSPAYPDWDGKLLTRSRTALRPTGLTAAIGAST